MLFHVEQHKGSGVEVGYRVRWPESRHEDLRDWGGERVGVLPVMFPLLDLGVAVECQWRGGADEDWEDAVAHEWRHAEADFQVTLVDARGGDRDRELDAGAVVCGYPSFYRLVLPEGGHDAGSVLRLVGVSLLAGVGQMFEAGEFVARGHGIRIVSASGSRGGLVRVDCAMPGHASPDAPRMMLSAGSLDEGELAALEEWLAGHGGEEAEDA